MSYTRDTMGHVSSVSAQPSGGTSTPVVSSVAYKPFGPYSGLTYGNAVAETRSFDQDYRLTGVTDTATFALQNLGYAYYPTNNVQTITDAVNSANSQTFSYDNLQRLSSAAGGYGSFAYTYDNDGNRLSQTHGIETTNYGYGTGSDLLATLSEGGVQTQAIGYTADGRIASLSPGIEAPGGATITSLSYNQDARLAAVNASGGALASYTYDGFGQRLIKTVSGYYGEIYQYGQNGMLLEQTNASGAAQADYIYLDGRPVATLNPSTGALNFLHDDKLGTPQLATDGSQTVAWQSTYEPFGQASVSGTITQNLRFPGQYFDVESGWNHNGFRNYLPDLGRYLEPDPLGMQGSARLYSPTVGSFAEVGTLKLNGGASSYGYAENGPNNWIDPMGLRPGTQYSSWECAGWNSIWDINSTSRKRTREFPNGREWGGRLYQNANGTYSYTVPVPGGPSGIRWDSLNPIPAGTMPAGWYHTHGAYDPSFNSPGNPQPGQPGYNWKDDYNEIMSGNDLYIVNNVAGVGFLGTPQGTILETLPGQPSNVLTSGNCGCN